MYPQLMSDESIKPLQNRVLIKEDPKQEYTTSGGIIVPQTVRDGKFYATASVIAVGEGRLLKNGSKVPPEVKPGDRILLGKSLGSAVTYQGEEHRVVDADLIEGVIED